MNKELKEKLHDLSYVLSREEINELRCLCYANSNSWCPLYTFFNDISLNDSESYNKNHAFKDLWLIVLIVLERKEELKALQIIREKGVDVYVLKHSGDLQTYNDMVDSEDRKLNQEEFNLLKKVLFYGINA